MRKRRDVHSAQIEIGRTFVEEGPNDGYTLHGQHRVYSLTTPPTADERTILSSLLSDSLDKGSHPSQMLIQARVGRFNRATG